MKYNKGKDNPMYGVYRTDKDAPFYGKFHSEETKKKMSKANKGRKFTKNHKQAISIAKKGRPNGMCGYKHSEETKRKNSKA